MAIVNSDAPSVLRDYYRVITGGIDNYDDGRGLVPLLADDLDFEGPVAGHIVGATPFREGVKGFVAAVSGIDLIQEVHGPDGTAVIYDAHLPKGVTRLTEFFTFADGRIQRLRLLYDPADYLGKGGG